MYRTIAEDELKGSACGFKWVHALFTDKLGVDAEQICVQLTQWGIELWDQWWADIHCPGTNAEFKNWFPLLCTPAFTHKDLNLGHWLKK